MTDEMKKKKKRLQIAFALAVLFLISIFFSNSKSVFLENDTEVKPKSELTYYLTVTYDGVDKNGVQSDDTKISKINSGTIFVEDKIPEGLEFLGFVTTSDGTIGSVKRSDESICAGKVIDDTNEESLTEGVWNDTNTEYTYHGLHFNAETRTVTFKVKSLQAGCKLTVGIKTKTPKLDDPNTPEVEVRRDFYNYALSRERTQNKKSNTVHVFMGKEISTTQNVIYQYTGVVPDDAPSLPEVTTYAVGAKVGVTAPVTMEGYTFSGWTTTDVEVTNNSFVVPENDVIFTGSFTEDSKYRVTYTIDGTAPDDYVLPSEKEYYPDTVIDLDQLSAGTIINHYRFKGWRSNDVTIQDDSFVMPEQTVVIIGEFEEENYKVTYLFYDGVSPPNSDTYLPEEREYTPGDTVTLEDVTEPSGYKFLGWYSDSEFTMPSEDVTIYGEWKEWSGTFEPSITKEVIGDKEYYRLGDTINYRVIVTNNSPFPIKDVIVKENDDNTHVLLDESYTILTPHMAKIESIPANSSAIVYAAYDVTLDDKGTIEDTSELKGALADNGYELLRKDYTASAIFKAQSKLTICDQTSSSYDDNTIQIHITGNTNQFDTWVVLERNQCDSVLLDPDTYKIQEVIPQEYTLKSVTGAIAENGSNLVVAEGQEYSITFENNFARKSFLHSFGRIAKKVIQQATGGGG